MGLPVGHQSLVMWHPFGRLGGDQLRQSFRSILYALQKAVTDLTDESWPLL